mgnify:CR=1 FL=1
MLLTDYIEQSCIVPALASKTKADVIKLHSQEATLEEIFLQVTGKELSA